MRDNDNSFQKNFKDGLTLLVLYVLVLAATEGVDIIDVKTVFMYFGLFGVCTVALWGMDADYADALNRGAAMVIAGKLLSIFKK